MNSRLEDADGRPLPGDPWQRLRGRVRGAIAGDGESGARRTLTVLADFALAVPDLAHLVGRLVADPAVPARRKARLAAALAYKISPVDLLPGLVLGPVGLVDDLAVLVWALDGIVNEVPAEVLERHWAGSPEALAALRHAIAVGDDVLGGGLADRAGRLVQLSVKVARAVGRR